jgi:signal transduction histidine kinase
LKTSIETLDEERKRISQDLHDELGAVLSIARMHIVRLRDLYAKGIGNLEPNLQEVFKLTEAALATMRRISHELMPPTLNEFGLIKTIESTVRQINDSQKITAQFETPSTSLRWPRTVELNLYRIFMELVNNTLKHSQAKQIKMVLQQDADTLLFTYQDDGIGFKNEKSDGRGLSNIEMRVTTMGGTFRIDKDGGSGFHSTISIPTNIFLQMS